MSITLTATKFVNKDGDTKYGYIAKDDYMNDVENDIMSESEFNNLTDMGLLQFAVENASGQLRDALEHSNDMGYGMMINDTWYDYDEIKNVLTP